MIIKRFTLVMIAVALLGCADNERKHEYLRREGPAVQTVSVPLDETDRRDTVRVAPEETLVVRLQSQRERGYVWEMAEEDWDPEVLRVVDEPRVPFPTQAPADEPTWDVFTFRAGRTGSANLRFRNVRATAAAGARESDDDSAQRRYELRVNVRDDRAR